MRSRSISVQVCDNHISVGAHQLKIKQPVRWMISWWHPTAVQVKRSWKDDQSISSHREKHGNNCPGCISYSWHGELLNTYFLSIDTLTASLLLSHAFKINDMHTRDVIFPFTSPPDRSLLPEGAVKWNRHQLGFPACKCTCLELVKTQAAPGHTWFSTVKFQIPSPSAPFSSPRWLSSFS